MKNIIKIIVLFCILSITFQQVKAQDNGIDAKSKTIELQIPKLQILIDSALVNNGLVNYRRHEIDAKESNLKSKRKYWTRNFGIQADSRYGTFNTITTWQK